jgi:hypothetical protein
VQHFESDGGAADHLFGYGRAFASADAMEEAQG